MKSLRVFSFVLSRPQLSYFGIIGTRNKKTTTRTDGEKNV